MSSKKNKRKKQVKKMEKEHPLHSVLDVVERHKESMKENVYLEITNKILKVHQYVHQEPNHCFVHIEREHRLMEQIESLQDDNMILSSSFENLCKEHNELVEKLSMYYTCECGSVILKKNKKSHEKSKKHQLNQVGNTTL